MHANNVLLSHVCKVKNLHPHWHTHGKQTKLGKNMSFFRLSFCAIGIFLVAGVLCYPNITEYAQQRDRQQATETVAQDLLADLQTAQNLLQERPNDIPLRLNLSKMHFHLTNYAEAENLLAHDSLVTNEEAAVLRLRLHYARYASQARETGEQAEQEMQEWQEQLHTRKENLARINPKHPAFAGIEAMNYFLAGEYDQALEVWQALLREDLTQEQRASIENLIHQSEKKQKEESAK